MRGINEEWLLVGLIFGALAAWFFYVHRHDCVLCGQLKDWLPSKEDSNAS